MTARRVLVRLLTHPDSQFLPLDIAGDNIADATNLATDWIENHIDFTAALKTLSPPQREAAILAWMCDFSEKEIARTLEIRPGTVKVHLWRARRKLRQHKPLLARLDERRREAP